MLRLQDALILELGYFMCRKSTRQRKTAIWIRESLLALGPTFIKIGQLFSTRSDLLAAEYTEVRAPKLAYGTQLAQPSLH